MALIKFVVWSGILGSNEAETRRLARLSRSKLLLIAISDLCSRYALASVMFLTGPVEAVSLFKRLFLLVELVAGVFDTFVWCVTLMLCTGDDLPKLSGIFGQIRDRV